MEVCPLARGMMLLDAQSLSARLQSGFCLLHFPLPAALSARFAARFPRRKTTGLPRFACVPVRGRSRLSADGSTTVTGEQKTPVPDHVPFGPSPAHLCAQHLWLVGV